MTTITSNQACNTTGTKTIDKFWVDSANQVFSKLQKLEGSAHYIAPLEAKSWDRIVELKTDEWVYDDSIDYLCSAVDEIVKVLVDKDAYDDAIILPLIAVDESYRNFKILVLIKFHDHEDGGCIFMKAYRKFYANNDGYFYKYSDSEGIRKLNTFEVNEKISEFEYGGKTHYIASMASLPYINFSTFLSGSVLKCSYECLG